jgi:hypothetical protein
MNWIATYDCGFIFGFLKHADIPCLLDPPKENVYWRLDLNNLGQPYAPPRVYQNLIGPEKA